VPSAIVFDEVTKRFGRTAAVDRLKFAIPHGSLTVLAGPNGCGKTTAIRVLLGFARATSGRALVEGLRYADLTSPARVVGAVSADVALHPDVTGEDALRVAALETGSDPALVDGALDDAGIAGAAGTRVGDYSLGMRRRLSIAAAFLPAPRILVLDEPTNGLDPEGVGWFLGRLRTHLQSGGTVLMTTHMLDEVRGLADRIVVLADGRVARDEPVVDDRLVLRCRPADDERLTAALTGAGADVARAPDGAFLVDGLTAERTADVALGARIPLTELRRDVGIGRRALPGGD
jgi:ABC-2 type transport system ATP-binding protein